MVYYKRRNLKCKFCLNYENNKLFTEHPDIGHCNRTVKEDWDDGIVAFLASKPYVPGHTIVMPIQHYDDITDKNIDDDTLQKLFSTINKISIKMKTKLLPHPKKIYVCTLGEDMAHLHFHLIPRYDENWREKPGEERFRTHINRFFNPDYSSMSIPGFWYLAYHETRWNRNPWIFIPKGKEKQWFEKIAKQIYLPKE